jgi:DtxR family Mn-dependent transcriptional regulator
VNNRTHGIEEYLEALFKLQRGDDPVTVRRVAEELGVAPPSVSERLARRRASGLVEAPGEAGVRLTSEGELEGARLVRRHRLSERFLVDYLGMPWDAVHDEACKFEHVLSPEVEARLAEQLGDPRTCPHGHAIPQADGSLAEDELRPLSSFAVGESGIIGCSRGER